MPNRRQWGIGAAAVAGLGLVTALSWPAKDLSEYVMDAPAHVSSQRMYGAPGVFIDNEGHCASLRHEGDDKYVLSVLVCDGSSPSTAWEADLEKHNRFFALNRPPAQFDVTGYRIGSGPTQRMPDGVAEAKAAASRTLDEMNEASADFLKRNLQ